MKLLVLAALCFLIANVQGQATSTDTRVEAERAAMEAERARRRADAAERGEIATVHCPAERQVVRSVDLDQPGALADLERTNRQHYAMLENILSTRPRRLGDLAARMHTQMNACEVSLLRFFKTSLPPQAVITFVVDDTRYRRSIYVEGF